MRHDVGSSFALSSFVSPVRVCLSCCRAGWTPIVSSSWLNTCCSSVNQVLTELQAVFKHQFLPQYLSNLFSALLVTLTPREEAFLPVSADFARFWSWVFFFLCSRIPSSCTPSFPLPSSVTVDLEIACFSPLLEVSATLPGFVHSHAMKGSYLPALCHSAKEMFSLLHKKIEHYYFFCFLSWMLQS